MQEHKATPTSRRKGGRLLRSLRRFARRKDGAAAVEFSLVILPFMALLFAIIETAIVFFAGQTLETAVADSARLILTGQAQSGNFDQAAFKQQVCARIYGLFDCAGGISVDVRTYNNFASVNLAPPVDANGNLTNNFVYQPGSACDIVVVRLFYQWPIYMQLMGLTLANMSGQTRLLTATAAFRNEPFTSSATC
jgi:Flp pilus assembly protein TadG